MRMLVRWLAGFAVVAASFALARTGSAQPKDKNKGRVLPPANNAPRLILAHPGPHATVNALAFSPDGSVLYVAGFDKQVRRYKLIDGKFTADGSFRVPIGPGNGGVINALAVSPDGKWVAAAGRAPLRGEVWAGADDGLSEGTRSDPDDVKGDAGIIYLFAADRRGDGKAIRGPLGEVRALAFANPGSATRPILVAASIELDKGIYKGVLRAFGADGAEIAKHTGPRASTIPPGLAAYTHRPTRKKSGGADRRELGVALAWDAGGAQPGKLLVWSNIDGRPELVENKLIDDLAFNSTIAVRVNDTVATELITGGYNTVKQVGGLTRRTTDGAAGEFVSISGAGESHLPLGLAALGEKEIVALTRVLSNAGMRHELRTIESKAVTALVGMNEARKPVFAAAPNGKFVAVGGFLDNRVEVYETAALIADKAKPQALVGAESGFSKVAFLTGERLWLGRTADTTAKGGGGVVFDLGDKARAATPRGPNDELTLDAPDAPAPVIRAGDIAKNQPWEVEIALGGAKKTITLPAGEVATAAAALPAGPKWANDLGAVIAVAHQDYRSQGVRLTLFRAADGKPMFKLGGPTLPVRSLAFSATRPLLAAAGDDGTIAVWSLTNIGRPIPAIEGLQVAMRDGKVVAASIEPGSPAAGGLLLGDVIEAVLDAKGKANAVKTPLDFVVTVRALGVGSEAKITTNKGAVTVKVGTTIGFRHPLFDLWANPEAKNGKHAWVGWTANGPYDASGEDGEDRIGWLTATGDPAAPVTLAGAEQYRKLFYRRDLVRKLLAAGDYAISYDPPQVPQLRVSFPSAVERADGRLVIRERIEAVVALSDPDRTLDTSRMVLRWQAIASDGTESLWFEAPFGGGQAALKVPNSARGAHAVRARLFASATETTPLLEAAGSVEYVPPAPEFAVLIDGKPVAADSITTAANEKEVKVSLDAKLKPADAVVKVSWTGGEKAVELGREPLTISLTADEIWIYVSAANVGATSDDEARTIPVRVRKPAPIPKPVVTLDVLDPFDARPNTNDPYIVSAEKVRVRATATDATPVKAEWKIGNREWTAAKLVPNPDDAKTSSEVVVIDFAELRKEGLKGDDVEVRLRATGKGGVSEQAITIRLDSLPDISVNPPPAATGAPEMKLSGGLKLTSKRKFAVRVLVTSTRTGRTREFAPTPNAALTEWTADLTLFPGGNQLGYVVRYDSDRKELLRAGLVEVQYTPAPVVLGAAPLDIGTGDSGTLALVASSSAAAPELLVRGAPVGAQTTRAPQRVFGASVWMLTAAGVSSNPGNVRLTPVEATVRNAEGAASVSIPVEGKEPVVISPPSIALSYSGGAIAANGAVPPTGEPDFEFDVQVKSDTPLTRVEVWHGPAADAKLELLPGVSAAGAKAVGEGAELGARAKVRLRPGAANYVKVVAANGGKTADAAFALTFTPPPVQVQITSITDAAPGAIPIDVTPDNAQELTALKGAVEVKGRVVWYNDTEPAATDPDLSVVFVANGVRHAPIAVAPAVAGAKERTFSGRVYLNSYDAVPGGKGKTLVRAELRSGLRAVPQAGGRRDRITISSANPITQQRLHVLVFGVGVVEADEGKLARGVVTALGGTIPADNPNFTEGRFEQKKFVLAQLYRPQFGNAQAGHLNAMLNRVRADIARRSGRAGEEWVNDVILVYYQGADWKDASGRWRLHTATSVRADAATAAREAIRPDVLPPVPGMLVIVANVTGAEMTADPLAVDTPYLRYAWSDPTASAALLGVVEKAVKGRQKLAEIRADVADGLKGEKALVGSPIDTLTAEVLARIVGLK